MSAWFKQNSAFLLTIIVEDCWILEFSLWMVLDFTFFKFVSKYSKKTFCVEVVSKKSNLFTACVQNADCGCKFRFLAQKVWCWQNSVVFDVFRHVKAIGMNDPHICEICWQISSFTLKRTSLACENLYKKFLSKNSSLELPDSLCKAQNLQLFATILLQFSPFLEKCDFHFEWKSR